MNILLVAMTALLPLLLALGYTLRSLRHGLLATLPIAALPGLVLALYGSEQTLHMPWLLEGAAWGLDSTRRVFLAFSSLLWVVAGLFATFYFSVSERSPHFALFWLLTLSGNLGLLLAQDIASFYTFFALMTLSAYGLIVHDRTPQAVRAAKVYMAMALAGEMALLTGLIMAAAPDRLNLLADVPGAVAVSDYRNWIVALLFGGFGVKSGVAILHLWLPLAHPAAPTPASAVLSGAMIKAGLFGWLITLPLGEAMLPDWAMLLICAGLLATFGGAALGICQTVPKAVLAYSSISQMGLITVMVGAGLAVPEHWPTVMAAVVIYAMHHGLAKGALFLGVSGIEHAGGWPQSLVRVMVWLPGLSLSGLVLTSGAAGKGVFKDVLQDAAPRLPGGPWLEMLFSVGAVATTLLVLRYLWCLRPYWGRGDYRPGLVWCWLLATLCSLLVFWWLPRPEGLAADLTLGLAKPWGFFWPPLAGLLLAGLALALGLRAPRLPAGDLIVPLDSILQRGHVRLLWLGGVAGRLQERVVGRARKGGAGLLQFCTGVLQAEQPLRSGAGLIFISLVVIGLVVLLGPELVE